MADRKAFLLRLPPELLDELNRWARDELRSLNGQIEFLLRESLRRQRKREPNPAAEARGGPPAAAHRPDATETADGAEEESAGS